MAATMRKEDDGLGSRRTPSSWLIFWYIVDDECGVIWVCFWPGPRWSGEALAVHLAVCWPG